MQKIINYYQVTEQIATSGQPTRSQFQTIAEAGYKVIVNLALSSSKNALSDEGAIATSLGMAYFHIPVVWESPTIDDVRLFFNVMESVRDRKVWVHCALNMRVSCFLYLFQKHILNLSEERSRYPMAEIWQPQGVWQNLIQEAQTEFRRSH